MGEAGVYLQNYHVILDGTKITKKLNFVIPYSPYTFVLNAKVIAWIVTTDSL